MKEFLILTYVPSERINWFDFLYDELKDSYKITNCKIGIFIKGEDFIIRFVHASMKRIIGMRPDFHFGGTFTCNEFLRNNGSKELGTLDEVVGMIKGDLML